MAKRKIVKIDDEKCTGCGLCIPNCPEGAIQIIDGKARLVSDIFCDGLGACLGHCPEGAISTEEREAEPYDEKKTMGNIVKAGKNTIIAHLKHLKDHGETGYLNEALKYLKEKGIEIDFNATESRQDTQTQCGCPGTQMRDFSDEKVDTYDEGGSRPSQLKQWPIQLHLAPPFAPYFQGKDVLLVADCVGYTIGDFHKDYLKGRGLSIACPKLDSNQEIYLDKLIKLIDGAKINTLTVMTMEVPCCNGLLFLAKKAAEKAKRKIPIKSIVVGIKGDILKEEWV
ncbi:4Fe-4S ferredoxin [Thermoplasmatales archaeon SG8-52-4]|nr:MAG: 4Fe-4S ferredoxin [Thermoplasmatales archaeon SG8-52-4]